MRSGCRWTVLLLAATGACGEQPQQTDDETMAEIEAMREQTRLRVFGDGKGGSVEETKQAQFNVPCLPYLCQGDISQGPAMVCGAFTPTKCEPGYDGSLACSLSDYNNLPRPVGGVVRYYFINAPTQFEGTQNVCFEIDMYVGNGKRGRPHLNVAGPNGWQYYLNNVQSVYMRTGYHVYGAVWGNDDYNVYLSGGSSGQGANEQWPHSLPPGPGWISSVSGFYQYEGQWPEYQGYGP
jgi:hypothetical protein